ncbi:uncharacterized protein Bfra_005188 [Botrytis fragariae]|uniref:Uncharacterized protein n=1 Tax=Botrytis fragariae TaxID=1964551 RepID=A0A8H6AUG7_9HELO|nr:uncharacterized protein Bfra_005188 [Botrytis fragariae]KAF5873724.1 hypothetical protein Bfra_005188 [Botrytis fragariae]
MSSVSERTVPIPLITRNRTMKNANPQPHVRKRSRGEHVARWRRRLVGVRGVVGSVSHESKEHGPRKYI